MESSEPQTPISLQSPQKPPYFHSSESSDRLESETNNSQPSWSTNTPKKHSNHPQRSKRSKHSAPDKLPEQYDILLRLFNGLDSALRLLRMRKSVPFFTKIRAIVESIAGRRFAHRHLAQMKYLLPERILIKKVSLVDEATGCMKRDLHVTLIRSVTKKNKKRKRGADHSHCVKKLFRSLVLNFLKEHPEGTEIPDEELPAPFNEQLLDPAVRTDEATGSVSNKASSSHVHQERPQMACHLSRSFKRHFSDQKIGKVPCYQPETDGLPPPVQAQDSHPDTETPEAKIPQIAKTEMTPLKSATTPAKLMVNTPALQTPQRNWSFTPDKNSTMVTKSVSRPSAVRSLKFDCLEKNDHAKLKSDCVEKNAHVELELDDVESTDILEILPHSLVQSLKEKEVKTEEHRLRQRVLKSLPKLFDRIYYLFQSIKYSSIRKEALLHRLTTCHCDIVDESEVEEQLKLLQEVLPDWISQKLSPSSSVLLSIDKSLDPIMLRAKLQKAT